MSLAALSPQGVVAGATRRQLGKLQPLALKAGQSPLMAMTSIRNPTAVDRTSSPRRSFACLGVVALSVALAISRAIALILTDSQAPPWVCACCYAKAPWRQTEVCCNPCPLTARIEPPGRHRSSTGSPYESRGSRFLEHLRRRRSDPDCSGTFSVQVEPFWGQAPGRLSLMWLQFGLAAAWTYVWASLRWFKSLP